MIFDFPSVSFLRKTFLSALAVAAGIALSAFPLGAAPLLIVTEAGARAVFRSADAGTAGAAELALGVADADGILLVPEAPGAAGTLTLTHPDAAEALSVPYDPEKTAGKLSLALKLRPAVLIVSALPADETEIFVDGRHCGRGAATLGGVVPRKKMTVEARSVRRGMQSRVVSAEPGEELKIKFDLRGNEVAARPDGQIVLPELPLVLASQAGATIRADGAFAELEDGAVIRGLEPGERIIEIFLPWRGREVCVWRAAVPARSAMLPGADVVAAPNPAPAPKASPSVPAGTPAAPAESAAVPAAPEAGRVLFSIGTAVTVSLGANDGLRDGTRVPVIFGEAPDSASAPVSVNVSGVSPTRAILRLPEGVPVPEDGAAVRLAAPPEK